MDWDGQCYDTISSEMERLGLEVLERLPLGGGEVCLDGGCGSGRITEHLARRVPKGQVYAMDADGSMVEAARERLSGLPNVEVLEGSLTDFSLPEPVDAAFSTAVFHWIPDHALLFRSLRSHLKQGGRLEAQCGGEGNLRLVHGAADRIGTGEPYATYLADFREPTHFPSPEETERLLQEAGFTEAECWLSPRLVTPDHIEDFLRTVILAPRVALLPESLQGQFARQVCEQTQGGFDYMRLNISARA